RQPDDAAQPLDAHEAIAQAETSGRHAEAGALVAVAQVAAGGEVHAAADAVAGDLGDGRLGEVVERLVALLGDRVVAHLDLGIGALAFELGDIGAAHEGLAAGAAYYHAADFGILGVILQDADEAVPHVERNSFSLGGIIKLLVPGRAVASAVD